VLNEHGQVKNIKLSDISKKFEKDRKAFGADYLGNTLSVDNVVKCVEGRFKGRKGVIKHIYKNTLFLWDREFT
jgi:transcription elongation factor